MTESQNAWIPHLTYKYYRIHSVNLSLCNNYLLLQLPLHIYSLSPELVINTWIVHTLFIVSHQGLMLLCNFVTPCSNIVFLTERQTSRLPRTRALFSRTGAAYNEPPCRKKGLRAVASQLQSNELSPSVGRREVGKDTKENRDCALSAYVITIHYMHIVPAATSG